MTISPPRIREVPNELGRFGAYGGQFVPETLMAALGELEAAYETVRTSESFWSDLSALLKDYVGRPTPLYRAQNLARAIGGDAQVWIKREDLAHTGAHKINNVLGQIMLAERLGKSRIIAETGAGQHGVATATACAMRNMECVVYMGEEDIRRQAVNVYRMKLLGASVVTVTSGSRTLKDAINEAIRDWVTNVRTTHYLMGSAVGPHPYPMLVRDLQTVIGTEARQQCLAQMGALPDYVVACVGGGSNAIGIFSGFVDDADVQLIGVEAAGDGIDTDRHAATMSRGSPGALHGSMSYMLQDAWGQVLEAHSISAGLDYPGVGPEHSYLKDLGRARYVPADDEQALAGFDLLTRTEGIIPALEPAHAIGYMMEWLPTLDASQRVLLLLSGRGDKDLDTVMSRRGMT